MSDAAASTVEVAVVGAGLSGLAAAYHLAARDVVVLEASPRAGGRVLTRCRDGLCYELGATVGYEPTKVPFPIASTPLIGEYGPIALLAGGAVHRGDSVLECLRSALPAETLNQVERYAAGLTDDLSPTSYDLVNAFFKVIHPGEMRDYRRTVHQDAFRRYYPSHYAGGNEELVRAFLTRVRAPIRYATPVLSIVDDGDAVTLRVGPSGAPEQIRAQAVVVATPAHVAGAVVATMHAECRRVLSSVRYGEYTIVALGFSDSRLAGLSYVVTPSLPPDMVCELSAASGTPKVVLAFYGTEATRRVAGCSDLELVTQVRTCVEEIGGAHVADPDVLFHDVQRWPIGGTIISGAYADWHDRSCRASPRVVLAGDYLDAPYPYGMKAAMSSGHAAADVALAVLGSLGSGDAPRALR